MKLVVGLAITAATVLAVVYAYNKFSGSNVSELGK